jgi:hypothetical protein
VIEEQRLEDGLENIDQVIVPANMRQLVGKHCAELLRAQARHRPRRHEDHRPQPADEHGNGGETRLEDLYGPEDAQACAEINDAPQARLRYTVPAPGLDSLRVDPVKEEPKLQKTHADDPQRRQLRQHLGQPAPGDRGAHLQGQQARGRRDDRRRLPAQQCGKRRDRGQRHQGHAGTAGEVARVGVATPQAVQDRAKHGRDQRSLPDEMHQRPAEGRHQQSGSG